MTFVDLGNTSRGATQQRRCRGLTVCRDVRACCTAGLAEPAAVIFLALFVPVKLSNEVTELDKLLDPQSVTF